MYEKSVTYQFIVNTDTYDALTPGTSTVDDLTAGMGGFVDSVGVLVENSTSAGDRLRFAQRLSNGQLVYSPFFIVGEHLSLTQTEAVAATAHTVVVGESGEGEAGLIGQGTSGVIEAGETYTLSLLIDSSQGALNNTPIIKTVPYRAKTDDTQLEVARGLFDASLNIVNRNLPGRFIKVGRVFNVADDANIVSSVGNNATVTYNSTTVSQTAHDKAVGDLVDFDGDWYILTAVETDSYTIDRPYQGDSDTIAHADVEYVLETNVAAGTWSLQFTGMPIPFDPVVSTYRPIRFSITTSGFDPSLVITETAGNPGTGTYAQVAQQEVYSAMNEGKPFIQAYPPTKYRLEADPDNTYDITTVEFKHDSFVPAGTGVRPVSVFKLIIASDSDLTATEYDNYGTILNR